jgi:hypothetical protein
MQLYRGDATLTPVRWFFADKAAPFLPYATCFGSYNWWNRVFPAPHGPGPSTERYTKYDKGGPPPLTHGNGHQCGDPDAIASGAIADSPRYFVDMDGTAECCLATDGEPSYAGVIPIDLGWTSTPHPLHYQGLMGAEIGFTSLVTQAPTYLGALGIDLGWTSTPRPLHYQGLMGAEIGFTSLVTQAPTYLGALGIDLGWTSVVVQAPTGTGKIGIEVGFKSSTVGPLSYAGKIGIQLGFNSVIPTGVATACCPGLMPLAITCTVTGQGSCTLTYDGVQYWFGTLALACGGTLHFRWWCNGTSATGWVLNVAWDTVYVPNTFSLSTTKSCSSPYLTTLAVIPSGSMPGGCSFAYALTVS